MHNIFFRAEFLMLCSIIELYNADLNRYFWIEVKILESTNHSNSDNSVEKAMATHSSTLVWKIPWMVEPGRLRPMGSLRVRHDWASSLSLFAFMYWRRKRQTTPVFLPGNPRDGGCWWRGEPGGLPSMGSHRVGHDWSDLAAAAAADNSALSPKSS